METPCPLCGAPIDRGAEVHGQRTVCARCGATVAPRAVSGDIIDVRAEVVGSSESPEESPLPIHDIDDYARQEEEPRLRGSFVHVQRTYQGEPGCCCGAGCLIMMLILLVLFRGCAMLI